MNDIATGENDAADFDFVADFERSNFFFGERECDRDHLRCSWCGVLGSKRNWQNATRPQPRWGCRLNLGPPRVAPATQPWALGRNPFGMEISRAIFGFRRIDRGLRPGDDRPNTYS